MTSTAGVAAPIPHLVPVEMIEGLISAFRMWTNVAVMRIKAVIDMAVKVARPVKPRAGSDEHAACKPLGPIVPIRGAVVWGIVVVAIRAPGSGPILMETCAATEFGMLSKAASRAGKANNFQ
jgi:hypothetical protein